MAESRRINAYDVLQGWMEEWKPDCLFDGATAGDYHAWRMEFSHHYRECLGPWPERVPLNVTFGEVQEREDHVRRHLVYDSSPGVSVPAWLLEPKGAKAGEPLPAVLACHGHGGGKDEIVGVSEEEGTEEERERVRQLNYTYAREAARRGYVVIAPDWLPFGERRPPDEWSRVPGRDPCNVVNMGWQYFGRPLITQNVWDGMRAVDVLLECPNVDGSRIGVIGLSYGGTMSTHLLINDERLRVGVVSGYVSTVRGDALNMRGKANTCGAQHVPRLLLHGDIPEMLGLAVPKPVLFEMGEQETCFHYPDMAEAYARLQRIYDAAGVGDRIKKDVFPRDHSWSGKKAWQWLESWL